MSIKITRSVLLESFKDLLLSKASKAKYLYHLDSRLTRHSQIFIYHKMEKKKVGSQRPNIPKSQAKYTHHNKF
jgi:hypothetical protein